MTATPTVIVLHEPIDPETLGTVVELCGRRGGWEQVRMRHERGHLTVSDGPLPPDQGPTVAELHLVDTNQQEGA